MAQAKGNKGGTKPATPGAALPPPPAPANLPSGFKVTRRVTMPSLALKKTGDNRVLLFMDAMRVSNIKGKPDADGKTREPATVSTVTDLQTGEQLIFIVPSVVKANLERDYPKDSYVGKAFAIENRGRRNENQRYNDFSIMEVEKE